MADGCLKGRKHKPNDFLIMKTFKYLAILVFAVLAFSSCDSDPSWWPRTLTPEERQSALKEVKGDYHGKMTFYTGKNDEKTGRPIYDSLKVEWSIISDSILIIKNLPSKVLVPNTSNTLLQGALASAPNFDLKCKISFYQNDPAQFLINPVPPVFKLHYADKDHTVQQLFFIDNILSFGGTTSTHNLMLRIIPGSILVDGNGSRTFARPEYRRTITFISDEKVNRPPKK